MYKTTDYDQFRTIVGNRKVVPIHVRNLKESISEHNRLEQHPITVNERMEVIDGQHRLQAAIELGVPIYYTVKRGDGLTQVQKLQVQREWRYQDYVDSYVERGFTDYIILKEFVEKHKTPIVMSANLMMNRSRKEGRYTSDLIKSGEFEVRDLRKATEVVDMASIFIPYLSLIHIAHSGSFLQAVKILIDKGISKERVEKKLAVWNGKIYSQPTSREYMRIFEDIINWYSKKRVRLYE